MVRGIISIPHGAFYLFATVFIFWETPIKGENAYQPAETYPILGESRKLSFLKQGAPLQDDTLRYLLYYMSQMADSRLGSHNHNSPYDRGVKRIGSEFLGKRSMPFPAASDDDSVESVRGSQISEKRLGSEFLGKRLGSEFLGKRLGSEFLGKRLGSEFLGKRLGSEFLGKRLGSEFLGKRSIMGLSEGTSTMENDTANAVTDLENGSKSANDATME